MLSWRVLAESVIGTSHLESGIPCQDTSLFLPVFAPAGIPFVVAAVSDGAGSAIHSESGAKCTVRAIVESAAAQIEVGTFLDEETLLLCFQDAHEALQCLADRLGTPIEDLACTALMTIAGPEWALMGQIGDGAIVAEISGSPVRCIPSRRGEYLNETDFLTSLQYRSKIRTTFIEGQNWFAMLTDGLEHLAIRTADDSPSAGFFTPFIKALSEPHHDPDVLSVALEGFLSSDRINQKTDDDKTLLLALLDPLSS